MSKRRLTGLIATLSVLCALVWVNHWQQREEHSSAAERRPKVYERLQSRVCPRFHAEGVTADCYWYTAAEGFRLPVVVMRIAGLTQAPDPLVYLEGGPGQGGATSADMLSYWAGWLLKVRLDRPFILFEYRGLSPGSPTFDCPQYTEVSRSLLQQNLSIELENKQIAPVLEACLDQFQQHINKHLPSTTPLANINSAANAEDAEGIVRALGFTHWNALGVSYGTRVALVAASRASGLQRLVLDSPYPPGRGGLLDSAQLWQRAFDQYWRTCEEDQPCADKAPLAERDFWELVHQLKQQPVRVRIKDWHSNQAVEWLLNDSRLLTVIYGAFYSSAQIADIGQLITKLQNKESLDNFALLERFYNQAFDPALNAMVFFATECNDNWPDSAGEFDAWLAQSGVWREYFADGWAANVCRHQSFSGEPLARLVEHRMPVLVAVGELDPITPPSYAQVVRESFSQAVIIELPGKSHAEFYDGDCGAQWISHFLSASEQELLSLAANAASLCSGGS